MQEYVLKSTVCCFLNCLHTIQFPLFVWHPLGHMVHQGGVPAVLFPVFLGYFDPEKFFVDNEHNFRVDVNDTSAK